jgi:magnesium transporter
MPRSRARTVQQVMEPAALLAPGDESIGVLRSRLLQARPSPRLDHADVVCVVDAQQQLLGTVPLGELLTLPDNQRLASVAHRQLPRVGPDTEQEHVASLALHHKLTAVPVTDAQGRLLGVVGAAALLRILRREHVEDLHRLAGIGHETDQARNALEAPPLRRMRHRLPWLIVGLLGSTVATFIVARFEGALAAKPALAFFVPGLVYLADAIGTQSEAVAVRGLSLSRVSLGHLLGNELRTGLLIGLVLASLAFPMIWITFGELQLAAAVAIALGGASVVASLLGLVLPWLLGRLGTDPAYGSGPLATIVQDVLSLLIYFASVSWIVL